MKLPFFYCFFPQPSRKTLKTWQKKKIHAAFCFTTRRKEKHWKHTFNRLYTLVRSVLLNYFDLTSVIQSCDTIGGKIYQVPGNISPICPERKNGMTWLFCQCQRAETFHILETAEGRQITALFPFLRFTRHVETAAAVCVEPEYMLRFRELPNGIYSSYIPLLILQ